MMCYMDRTWCPKRINQRCSRREGCYRAFTDEDEKNAEEWWGNENFPLSVFGSEPECFVPLPQYAPDGEE